MIEAANKIKHKPNTDQRIVKYEDYIVSRFTKIKDEVQEN